MQAGQAILCPQFFQDVSSCGKAGLFHDLPDPHMDQVQFQGPLAAPGKTPCAYTAGKALFHTLRNLLQKEGNGQKPENLYRT